MSSLEEVSRKVAAMKDEPLDYGELAARLYENHMLKVDEKLASLRVIHSSFAGAKELAQSESLPRDDKHMLFACLRLPSDQRDAWFENEATRFAVAKALAKHASFEIPRERGFPVGCGRLLLTGAPSKKELEGWVSDVNCVMTLLRSDELQDRKLDLAAGLSSLGVEWHHMPITGAALEGANDREMVISAAGLVDCLLKSGKCVVVHCSAGLHRTGIVAYLALRLGGHSKSSAFELLGQVRWDTRAELERLHYRSLRILGAEHGATMDLVGIAECLLQNRIAGDSPNKPETD
mmetsp:Transcript_82519/g.129926  ORF Transcript_82519/g.129926 Transcript_82519/m.129926 type:complete len:292 (+) Transcript_82519:1-876(+)